MAEEETDNPPEGSDKRPGILQIIDRAKNLLSGLSKEAYITPTSDQIVDSLTAMRDLLDEDKHLDSQREARIALKFSKWHERMAYSTARERVELANDFYKLAAGRNADLTREAPEIVERILEEYAPPGRRNGEIKDVKAPIPLLRESIEQKILSISKQNQPK